MDFTRQILANRQMLVSDLLRRTEAALAPFHVALNCFLATLFQSKLPANWRQEWHRFVAWQLGEGIRVDPQSVRELEDWMEDWARFCKLLPTTEMPTQAVAVAAPGASRFGVNPPGNREEFFDQQLARAQRQLDEIPRVLSTLGGTLDAETPGQIVDVNAEVIAIEESIWQYNAAVTNARAAWLRDLSADANRRLLALRTPHRWGLPEFTDELQAQQSLHQESLVNERLRRRNESVERVDAGPSASQIAETPNGIALGAGATMTVTKQNARWIVFKTLPPDASQSIHGINLAAAVIAYILRHRPGRRDPIATFPSLASQMRQPANPTSAVAAIALKSQPNPPAAPSSSAKPRKPPSPPANWPKLTPEEIKRSERAPLGHWWPAKPIGETDWIWLASLERHARTARDGLVVFYHEVATLGRMAKELGDAEVADLEPLYAQREGVQRAYDIYVKSLIEVESVWTKYLKETRVFVGIHVIALKNKIDRALPTSVEGFHSTLDGQLKVEMRQSSEALRAAQRQTESAYTTAVWTDRVITIIFISRMVFRWLWGISVTIEAGIAKGLAPAAARRAAIALSITRLAIAAGSATAIDYAVPKILVGAGFDEADVRAGMAVFAALTSLVSEARSASTKPQRKTDSVNKKDSNYQSPPSAAPGRGKPPVQNTKEAPPLPLPNVGRKFWVKSVIFKGVKVYQRDDLIDPKLAVNGRTNLQRMQAGNAPIGSDGKEIILHHTLQIEGEALAELTTTFHRKNSRALHINPNSIPSGIDRTIFREFRAAYWIQRTLDFGGGKR